MTSRYLRGSTRFESKDIWELWLLAQRRASKTYARTWPNKVQRYAEALFYTYRYGRSFRLTSE